MLTKRRTGLPPKITDAAIEKIQTQINENFVKTIAGIAADSINTADSAFSSDLDTLEEEYMGRSLVFLSVSFLQSTVIAVGNVMFLEIQCESVFLYFLACWITALVFTIIIYTLTVSFGSIGKALAVIWLVMQVAGSGGTFPVEVLPNFFRGLASFMPFAYAVNAMRETVGGLYGYSYIYDLLRLLAFVPFALLLGLVLWNPLYRLNEFFEKKLHETKFMN